VEVAEVLTVIMTQGHMLNQVVLVEVLAELDLLV
jgi:hypothetical protein